MDLAQSRLFIKDYVRYHSLRVNHIFAAHNFYGVSIFLRVKIIGIMFLVNTKNLITR
jgi:hypothetical protein